MISYLKQRKYNAALKSHPSFGFSPSVSQINHGNKVGILSDIIHRSSVDQLVHYLKGKNRDIKALYYSDEEVEGSDVYTKKQIAWAGYPVSQSVDDFLSVEYDRLLYIDTKLTTHQFFIYSLAKCRFSIGPYFEGNTNDFDLTISKEFTSIQDLIDSVKENMNRLSIT